MRSVTHTEDFKPMVNTKGACKPSQCWILLVGLGFLVWTWLKTICFVYDLGFGVQQLISNSQSFTNNSQTPRDFPKQTPLNPTMVSFTERNVSMRHLQGI